MRPTVGGRACRARPPAVPDSPDDGRRRTTLRDLPEWAAEWARETLGLHPIGPVDWLVNVNHGFKAAGPDGSAFVKVVQQPGAGERVARERAVLDQLHASGLPVPRCLSSVQLAPDVACIATEWIEARPLRYLDVNGRLADGYMQELGELLRDMHRALASASDLPVPAGRGRLVYAPEAAVTAAARLLGDEAGRDFEGWIASVSAMLDEWPLVPIHGDLQDKNLLLSLDGGLFVCDFEVVGPGLVLRELLVDRYLLKARLDEDVRDRLQQQLVEGYGIERVSRLRPEAWPLLRADYYARLLEWMVASGTAELASDQRDLWESRLASLRRHLGAVKISSRHRASGSLLPQWYFGTFEILTSHPGFAPLIPIARARFGAAELRVDSQSIALQPGASIGVPQWQATDWVQGGALLLLHATEDLVEVQDASGCVVRPAVGTVVDLSTFLAIRFVPATTSQNVSLVLVRRRTAKTPAPLVRESCRVFPPTTVRPGDPWTSVGTLEFESSARHVGRMEPATTWQEIVDEPSLSTTRIAEALEVGGPLLRRFVEALPEDWRHPDADVVVSVRRNELAPGWTPTPVGWHIDGTHTAGRLPDGRANLRNPGNTVQQILACCGPAAPTRFLVGHVRLSEPPLGAESGARWQQELEQAADAGVLQRWNAPPDTLLAFGFGDFHTGAVSVVPGWRCFIKAMRGRGQLTHGGPVSRGSVSWPAESASMPLDPCGVFPDSLP